MDSALDILMTISVYRKNTVRKYETKFYNLQGTYRTIIIVKQLR